MEPKTIVIAEEGRQELKIRRQFDLPVALLFQAYTDPAIVEQWMGNKVLQMDNRRHGSYCFETSNAAGIVLFRANGVIHEFVPGSKITRTFEMENTPFPVQLEFLTFEAIGDNQSLLTMHIIFQSIEYRNQLMQMPFASGINMAHNRLQVVAIKHILHETQK